MNISIKNIQGSKRKFNVNISTSLRLKDPSIEWKLKLKDNYTLSSNKNVEIELNVEKADHMETLQP